RPRPKRGARMTDDTRNAPENEVETDMGAVDTTDGERRASLVQWGRRWSAAAILWLEASLLAGLLAVATESIGMWMQSIHDTELPGGLSALVTTVAATIGTTALLLGVGLAILAPTFGFWDSPALLTRRVWEWGSERSPRRSARRAVGVLVWP